MFKFFTFFICFCIFLLIFLKKNVLAQEQNNTKINEKTNEKNVQFIFKLDNRFSFARDQMISIYGFRTGLRLFKRHEIGLGLNWLGSNNVYAVPSPSDITNNPNATQKAQGTFFYKYVGGFYEPILYKTNKWAINLPLQFGGGKAGIVINNAETGEFMERREARYLIFEPALSAEYKISRFFGVGFGGGYRFAFSEQKIVYENLTKPVFIIKIKLYLENIYFAVVGKKEKIK